MDTVFEIGEGEKEKLKKPFGELVRDKDKVREVIKRKLGSNSKFISVGDYSAKLMEKIGLEPHLEIIDGKIERESVKVPDLRDRIEFKSVNPNGKITAQSWKNIKRAVVFSKGSRIHVEGEEDLLALPSIYFAPKGSVVIYGLRDKGTVIIEVNQDVKQKTSEMLGREKNGTLIVGGTWDRLHIGHKFLLLTAYDLSDDIIVGITSESMSHNKKNPGKIQEFDERKNELEKFLDKYFIGVKYRIEKIKNFKGCALNRGDSILVTEETRKKAERINKLRVQKGKKELKIIEIGEIRNHNGDSISSSKIRSRDK